MFWKRRRKWLVTYMFTGGWGRIFMTTDDKPLSSALVGEIEDCIKRDDPERKNLAVTNVVKLERVGWR